MEDEVKLISDFAVNLSDNVQNFPISEAHKVEIVKKCSETVIMFKKITGKILFPLIWFDPEKETCFCVLNSTPFFVQIEIAKDPKNFNFFGIETVSEPLQDSTKIPGTRSSIAIAVQHYLNRPDVATKDRKFWAN